MRPATIHPPAARGGGGVRTARLVIAVLISSPIWFYLIYRILESIQASELMWFLFWVYVPFTLAMYILALLETDKK